jgi:hypothetical protein
MDVQIPQLSVPFTGLSRLSGNHPSPLPIPCQPASGTVSPSSSAPNTGFPNHPPSQGQRRGQGLRPRSNCPETGPKVRRASGCLGELFPGRHFGSLFTFTARRSPATWLSPPRLTAARARAPVSPGGLCTGPRHGGRPMPARAPESKGRGAGVASPTSQRHSPFGGGDDCWECWFPEKTCSGRSAGKQGAERRQRDRVRS